MNVLQELYASDYSSDEDSESVKHIEIEEEKEKEKDHNTSTTKKETIPSSITSKYHFPPSLNYINHKNCDNMRQRTVWSTFIYLEWRIAKSERIRLHSLINQVCKDKNLPYSFTPAFFSDLGAPLPLHVSLTRNIEFHSIEQRDLLKASLEKHMHSIEPFTLEFLPLFELYRAHYRSGLFIGFPVSFDCKVKQIEPLINQIGHAMKDVNILDYSKYLINPSTAHVSLGQALNLSQSKLEEYMTAFTSSNKAFIVDPRKDTYLSIPIKTVCMDQGRQKISFYMTPKSSSSKSPS
ncbi:hypothetical protein TBLA_0A03990 [Henningerozyma blattae CBS 6284]|uniref:U6 snRNA phosphodiesterase n=1 Tax=Henningerozyma blattae (strain ATCC 34711 / CBS 6284 / DSM 70876 / NBRC 10599 / NRRL Y-10934 / UCD 77-7) TaxID=1071380 RepID=I2GVP3_HENB6|nr:hypothetical protein TBLA_0A03990 [Tetrapisispora blattae CBS 6284]CCH58195.1 hypothetical protein TBLA_0A03990 [Tetrapisispora blattae CBS 6284]